MIPLSLAIAACCALVMGFATQRGATCMVAAVGEIIRERRYGKSVAILEAAIWVATGLTGIGFTRFAVAAPSNYAVGIDTVIGGLLMGVGAWINAACVFGSVAKLGSGKWDYLFSPPGYFLGCAAASVLGIHSPRPASAPAWIVTGDGLFVILACLAGWRIFALGRRFRPGDFLARIWEPHQATLVIGLTFLVMLATVGDWAYTRLLSDLAKGAPTRVLIQSVLFACLLAGAVAGGGSAGRFTLTPPPLKAVLRRILGGGVMGLGSVLIPGGNDGLLLVGAPFLLPFAWVALAAMATAIALCQMMSRPRRL